MNKKRKHIRFVTRYLYHLKYETLNRTFKASSTDFKSKRDIKKLKNNTLLIQKYQRRLFLLKF